MNSLDLDALVARVPRPDDRARVAARERLHGTRVTALGRLADLAAWLAGAQGGPILRQISRARLLVVAADHGIAEAGVSAQPVGATNRLVRALVDGTAPAAVAAAVVGVSVRVVDAGVQPVRDGASEVPPQVISAGVRRGSGRIDREPALTRAEAEHALLTGIRLADTEADEGTDLLLVAATGRGATTPAAAVVGALAGVDAASVVGIGGEIDDQLWMRKTAAVRDALRRARPVAEDPLALLATAGGADLAVLSGLLLQAAIRRTPVVLDGLGPAAAALVSHHFAPAAADWWLAAHQYREPAYDRALAMLALEPLLDLRLTHADGLGAVLTVPLLRTAAALLAEEPCSKG